MAVDKELLLKRRGNEATVQIDGVGEVRVRGLSRGEVFAMQEAKGTQAQEARIVHYGLVDPQMTEAEVREWQNNSPAGEMQDVVAKIQELSKLTDSAAKEAMTTFRDGPNDGVRVLPGTEALDDGGATA